MLKKQNLNYYRNMKNRKMDSSLDKVVDILERILTTDKLFEEKYTRNHERIFVDMLFQDLLLLHKAIEYWYNIGFPMYEKENIEWANRPKRIVTENKKTTKKPKKNKDRQE